MKRALLKIAIAVFSLVAFPALAFAQCSYTQVTATITDPNGVPYAFANVSADLVPSPPGGALCTGNVAFPGHQGPIQTSANGTFTMLVPANGSITPSGTRWQFTIGQTPGVAFPFGTGPQSFAVAFTISGSTQNITSTLDANAPSLTIPFGGTSGSISFTNVLSGTNANSLVVGSGGTLTASGTGTIAATSVAAAGVPNNSANTTGNAATATLASAANSLAASPSTCGAGLASTGIAANGNAQGCFNPAGLSNPMTTLADLIVGGGSGAATRLGAPTSPNGVPQVVVETPASGAATALAWATQGINNNAQSTTPYPIAATDCTGRIPFTGTANIAVTLPTATSLGVPKCVLKIGNFTTGANTLVTITPATWTIGPQASTTFVVQQNQWATLTVDGTNWDVDNSGGIIGPMFNVLASGAKGDCSTDDTVAIQAAINSASALNSNGGTGNTGGTVFFPTGCYVITDHGTNPDGSTYALHVVNRGIEFVGPSSNLYDTILHYNSSPSVFGTGIQVGDPKEATITSIARTGNSVTANFATMNPQFVVTNGSGGPNTVVVKNVTGGTTTFNGTFALVAQTATSATWAQTGSNESGTTSASSLIYSSPDNALEYDGSGGHFADINVSLYCTATAGVALANGSGSYVAHTAGIWDWRSGYQVIQDNRNGQNCQYGWGGVQSQLSSFIRSSPEHNSVGAYLGPRSDNTQSTKEWDQSNDTGLWVNGVTLFNLSSSNGASCGPSTYWLNITNIGPATGPPALGTSLPMRRPNTGINLYGNWTENDSVPACEATIGAGVGDTPGGSYPTSDINVYSHTSQDFNAVNFIDVDQADHIHVYYVGGYLNPLTGAFFNIMPTTCKATDLLLVGETVQQTWTPLANTGPCTGTAPVLQWERVHLGQWQVQQFNGTAGFAGIQLLPGNFGLTGLGTSSQANIFVNSGATSQVASFELEQAGTLGWRIRYTAAQHLDFLDVLNGNFPRIDIAPGGSMSVNAVGTGSVAINGVANSSTGPFLMESGGATPTTVASIDTLGDITGTAIWQLSANKFAGVSTCSSSTRTITLPITYSSQPVILLSDETTTGGAKISSKSLGNFTVACSGTSDVFDWAVIGDPN